MNVQPVPSGDVAADHPGEAAVDGDQQLGGSSAPVDRAGDGERHLAVVGRQVGELGPLVDRRRVVAVRADLELGDVAADEIAVVADRGEADPVVAVRELARRAVRAMSSTAATSVDTRGSVVGDAAVEQRVAVELPVDLGVEEVDDRRQHVDHLGAVVADLSRRLSRRLDEQRHAEHLLAILRR